MQKNKLIGSMLGATILGAFSVGSVFAASIISIQTLPTYENSNNFKISCTTDGTNAQFSYSKNGGAWTVFGSSINVTTNPGGCIVQVDSSIINDQTTYSFKVNVDGTDSSVTSTIFDNSGPSPVSGFSKERINDGHNKLHFHTPSDSDFDSVIIYRGDSAGFSADSAHQIAKVSGGANSDMTYDDNFSPDPNKNYFYLLRAIDKAGNSSGLVGDGGTTVTSTTGTPKPGTIPAVLGTKTGGTINLPIEKGSVLSAAATPTPSATPSVEPQQPTNQSLAGWVKTHKKISILAGFGLAALGYAFYKFTKKK